MNAIRPEFLGARLLISVAALIVVIAGMQAAQSILVPFLFAFFLTILGAGPMQFLERNGVPSIVAVLLITLFFVGIFLGIGFLFSKSIDSFSVALPEYRERFINLVHSLNHYLGTFNIHLSTEEVRNSLETSTVFAWVGKAAGNLVSWFKAVLLVLILMVFMLFEASALGTKIHSALANAMNIERLSEVAGDVQKYLAIKTFTSALTGICVYFWVLFFNIDFAILWGLIAFLFNFVPVIGSIVASIPAILICLITQDVGTTIILTIGYIVVNIGISNFFEPILFGQKLGLSPLVVFLSLLFWGFIWGPAGMLLAIPLTMVAKIFLEHSDEFKWIAGLMGSKLS